MPNIATFIQQFAILVIPVLSAITMHELAHGYVAYLLGDPTAKNAGRLTLNPIKHLDPVGTIALFLIKIGWAKPVPINAAYFANQRQGLILVSVAGPATNFLLAVVFALLFHLFSALVYTSAGAAALPVLEPLLYMCQAGVLINIGLGVFNLLPVPPLDGSNILAGILPPHLAQAFLKHSTYGFIILILLLVSGGAQKVIIPIIYGMGGFLVPL
jgi:Zn-dependent protease